MDIGLPQISGIEGVRTIKSNFPGVDILMFTVFEENDLIFEAISAGASGYLLKKTPPMELLNSIRELSQGGAPMSPSIARRVIAALHSPPADTRGLYNLTSRESEILFSLVDGLSYKKIAEKYNLSISTVRSHICKVYSKLHVHSKSQAVAKALQGNNLPNKTRP
jgi:DNA-binding NarL/FixJ family response regulator